VAVYPISSGPDRYEVIRSLCLFAGLLLFLRYYLSLSSSLNSTDLIKQPSTEWFRGRFMCSFTTSGIAHLGWSIPLADPSYFVLGVSIHFFLMFVPFIVMYEQKGMILQGYFLIGTGPVLAALLSDHIVEQAGLWSLVSILQVIVLLFFKLFASSLLF
jgi:hypothetical protein